MHDQPMKYGMSSGKAKVKLQPKLQINQPGDRYEQEADAMADRVMRMSSNSVIQPVTGLIGRSVQRKCAACKEEEKKMQLMRKEEDSLPGEIEASPSLISSLNASKGNGLPLQEKTQNFMENSFSADFSNVRIHADREASDMSRSIHAKAFTYGNDIFFNSGQYQPESNEGKFLLAHELAHVVQQSGVKKAAIERKIFRTACSHDKAQGSGCGRIVGANPAGDEVQFPADRLIAESLSKNLSSGTWISQVYSPPNLAKGGKIRGSMDAVKVIEGSDLTLEVLEIKSRNNAVQDFGGITGGCDLAEKETQGYVAALKPLGPKMASISAGLEAIGGLIISDCRDITKDTKAKLEKAGVNTADKADMDAWCVLNGIQNRLGKKFTKKFASVIIKANEDGTIAKDYTPFLFPITCPDKKPGYQLMIFQVNKKGGLSYRCEKVCTEKRREELQKELQMEKARELDVQTQAGKEKFIYSDVIGDEDISEDQRVEIAPEGIDTTDIAIWGTGAVAAMAALHIAMQKAKTKAERELIRKAAEKVTNELARRGATEVAKQLDSVNISKLGTKAYEEVLEKAEKKVADRLAHAGEEKLAKKLAEKGLKKGAKTAAKNLLKKGAKAIPYIGAIITAVELLGAADAYAKGAEISFGIEGGDVDLGGDTKLDIKGEKPKDTPTTDAKLEDTQVDIELEKAPDMTGSLEIEAKKVTIKGKVGPDDSSILVNMKLKLENTTIIYKNAGRFKGGKVVIDGALDIKDSTIEIDLPKDAVLDPADSSGVREIKGAKIKITKVPTGTGPQKGEGPVDKQKGGEAGGTGSQDVPKPEEGKLLGEITKDEKLKKIYDVVFGPKGIKADKATLERFLALKAKLDAHPELVEVIIKSIKPGEITDPIKQLIEPMEQIIADKEKKVEQKTDTKPGDTPAPATSPEAKPEQKKDDQKGTTAAGPTDAEKAAATQLEFWKMFDAKALTISNIDLGDEAPDSPTPTAAFWVKLSGKTKKGDRHYNFSVHGTLEKVLPNTDKGKWLWLGRYKFSPPASLIKSTVGDEPINFTDTATARSLEWGAIKAPKKAKAGRKPKK